MLRKRRPREVIDINPVKEVISNRTAVKFLEKISIFFEQNEAYKEDNFICLNKLKKDLENIEDKYKSQKKITILNYTN